MSQQHGKGRRIASRLGLALVLVGAFAFIGGSAGAVTGSASAFESNDGNMVLNATSGSTKNATDWNCFRGQTGFQAATATEPDATHCKVTTGATHILGTSNGDLQWVSGQKFDTLCPSLNNGNNPPKDQFNDVVSYNDSNASNDTFFYGGNIRQSANGNASGDVEFNQVAGNGTTSTGCRTAGDKLLAYDYLNGGTSLDLHVLTWIDSTKPDAGQTAATTGKCLAAKAMPCWGANAVDVDGSLFDGESNQSAIAAAANGVSGAALVANQFAEFGVNLTDALDLTGCINFPQQVWESRSSGSSFTSNPEDIIIDHRTIQTCGEIKIIKQTDPRGDNTKFGFSSASSALPQNADAGGVACTAGGAAGVLSGGSFCLNDTGNAGKTLGSTAPGQNSTGNTIDATNVPQGTYTITENALTSATAAYTFINVVCTTDSTSGSTAGPVSGTQSATITLKPSGVVTCLFTNQLHQGAVLITKTGKNVNCTAADTPALTTSGTAYGRCTGSRTAALGGATFKITTGSASGSVVTGAGALVTDNSTGTVCFDGLSWVTGGSTYYVTETAAPTGYALPATVASRTAQVSVTQNATCNSAKTAIATGTGATASIDDDPLTNVVVTSTAQKAGATNSRITCTNHATGANIGNSPVPGASTYTDPATMTANGLRPGTYDCTVIVDP